MLFQTLASVYKEVFYLLYLWLQSNPGCCFDKKCQFMYKLVMEVSWNYK
ncbi:unnamed protein product [Rhodiola kirilowii]